MLGIFTAIRKTHVSSIYLSLSYNTKF